jgi:8-oxo-dGTP pyrophosphatase MutT (NUDIX family)
MDKNDYQACIKTYKREAVRAIIIKDNLLAMVKSKKFSECKFPGGGMEHGETHESCLIREVNEETGLTVILSSVQPFGHIKEKRASYQDQTEVFEMDSYYYYAKVDTSIGQTRLDQYEQNYGYELIWISIDDAIKTNELAYQNFKGIATWIERELTVLKAIKEEGRIG